MKKLASLSKEERIIISTLILRETIESFRRGHDLDRDAAEALLDALITESDEPLLAEVFRAWNEKGIGQDEIYSIAKIMRERCTRVNSRHETFIDIVGTGGSTVKTFNVSTAAAFVVAGAGVPVAKHGNKAATSTTGSADVLSELGVEPAVDAEVAERCLNKIGICFMFAPNFHRLSPTLAKVRRGLGFPTIFNCVGPLCNPAKVPHQLIGVWDRELVPKMADALARLGAKKSWIVHGSDGLDEIALSGPTFVSEVEDGSVREFIIEPSDLGLQSESAENAKAKSATESAKIIKELFAGKHGSTAVQRLVLINAAAAFYLAGRAADLTEGVRIASRSIDGGHALEKLNALAEAVKT